MKQLVYTRDTDENIFKAGKKGLHFTNREYMESLKDELIEAYADYHQKMDTGCLHQLSGKWEVDFLAPEDERNATERKRQFVHDLYKSNRPIAKNHKKDILDRNHCKTIICPICGIDTYDDWDHYVPRESMPEFSVLTSNLIPLCHECNSDKGTLWLNDERDHRLIFNAFVDTVPNVPVVTCTLIIDDVLNYPYVRIDVNPALRADVPAENIILTTVENLRLIEKYQNEADKAVKKMIQALSDRLTVRMQYGEVDRLELLREEKDVWRQHLKSPNTWNFLELQIFEELSKPEALTDWFVNL